MCVEQSTGMTMYKFQCKEITNLHGNSFSNLKGETTRTKKSVQRLNETDFFSVVVFNHGDKIQIHNYSYGYEITVLFIKIGFIP